MDVVNELRPSALSAKTGLREIEATAGMNWISDVCMFLRYTALREGFASCRVTRTYNYDKQIHYDVDKRPTETFIGRRWGSGVRYSRDGHNFCADDLVRVVAGLRHYP